MVDQQYIDLAHAYLDSDLNTEKVQLLEQALQQDADFCRWFVELHRREVALQGAMQLQDKVTTLQKSNSARIYRKRAHSHRGSQKVYWSVASAALLLISIIVGSFWFFGRSTTTLGEMGIATIQTSVNGVYFDSGHPIKDNQRLQPDDRIRLGASSQIRFDEARAQIDMIAESNMKIYRDGVELHHGIIDVAVERQPVGQQFRIFTPHAILTVIGTRFMVENDHQQTRLTVAQGIVEMKTSQWTRRLTVGESASSRDSAKLPVSPTPPADVIRSGVWSVNLIDSLTDQPVPGFEPLVDGMLISPTQLSGETAGLIFSASPEVVGIVITLTGPSHGQVRSPIERMLPFSYPRDEAGDIDNSWKLAPGKYQVVAQGFSDGMGKTPVGAPLVVHFTVTSQP